MGRREFIVLTSTTALAAAAFGQELLTQTSPTGAAAREFSLGYVAPDDSLRGNARGFSPNAMSADGVTSGDGRFIDRGVKVSVRGYNILPESPTSRLQMQLVTEYRENGTGRVFPFNAWSYTRGTGGAPPISFLVPVDQDQRLHLLFSSDSPASAARKKAAVAQPGEKRRWRR
jgi:hypothetical protein